MSRKFKPYVLVCVDYEGNSSKPFLNFDDVLIEKSKKFKGSRGGSGYSFVDGTRDISFMFKTVENASSFVKAVRRFKSVKEIHKQAILERDDG